MTHRPLWGAPPNQPPQHCHSHSGRTLTWQGNSYPNPRGSLLPSQNRLPLNSSDRDRGGGLLVIWGLACPLMASDKGTQGGWGWGQHPPN